MQQIETGFSHSVHNAQHCFRQILKALSEPGHQVELDKHQGFAPLNAAASQVIMSLCDQQTTVYLSPALGDSTTSNIEQAWHNLSFHNGVMAATLNQADFAVVSASENLNFRQLKAGSDESPEHSLSLIVQSTGFNQGPRFRLSGPGVKQPREIQLGELSDSIINYLLKPCHRYPLGIDFMFCHQQSLLAISRTSKLELI
ncbi:phosphonate C-P lyase system protein PhnH [Agarivorans sp. Alg241-V36]|uniref:phosphonate C-P lyase system protein PhnH n=1 Tax=Agarivorans sp. Alg241-V36 TaxID=2305992 RepID=UPI0013D0AC0C|nr:phosphonate C-P lyase system protein PhnH [Agarivorans sp. Alg241-V36]